MPDPPDIPPKPFPTAPYSPKQKCHQPDIFGHFATEQTFPYFSTYNNITVTTSIDFLPPYKQSQLNKVLKIILDAVQPEKVILFGSHARNRWVEDTHMEGHILHEYISDFDMLIALRRGDKRDEDNLENTIEARCENMQTPVSPIVHTIDFVNARLSEGQYFFSDIKKEGIMLYDAGNIPLAEPRALTLAERKQIAIDDYEHWFGDAEGFLEGVYFYKSKNRLNIAAFSLHQATERAYAAVMLVYTGYKPRTHNLGKLLGLCKEFGPELQAIFPRDNKADKYLFDLLKRAYIDARYKKTYVITEEELDILIDRVKQTHAIIERLCLQHIAMLDKEE